MELLNYRDLRSDNRRSVDIRCPANITCYILFLFAGSSALIEAGSDKIFAQTITQPLIHMQFCQCGWDLTYIKSRIRKRDTVQGARRTPTGTTRPTWSPFTAIWPLRILRFHEPVGVKPPSGFLSYSSRVQFCQRSSYILYRPFRPSAFRLSICVPELMTIFGA